VQLPDDVLVGIMYSSHNTGEVGEAVVGPIQFTQTATRATSNGLIAATATDENGKPVSDVGLVVTKGNDRVGTSVNEAASLASNTASFFLQPGTYSVQTAENDTLNAGTPVPFEIKTGQAQELKVKIGKAK
jgi:hypothetical protein